ncbi:Collagen triple helix repeat-containing protein [Croceitalea dokdonensis DOKDO 023]|uniref:Collagen triple helix repeat-containing protein n=1 Tax=Croceitalea dokdonensis DOKDO 023 TaxID=1300341 RepID=A0A0P7AEX0_9FLAO|nr:hypothetical protein [Croceitalea dokdonensis]KPM31785.1 Collagen triple helix repeat-containing protein [Croceitalea dokdonensis DOKDO 023]
MKRVIIAIGLFIVGVSASAQIEGTSLPSLPNLTTAEMNGATGVYVGSSVFNTDEQRIYTYTSSGWVTNTDSQQLTLNSANLEISNGNSVDLSTITGFGDNIYTIDGILTGDRAVTQNNFDLNFDANTLVVSGDNDRVGIGLVNPNSKLHINNVGTGLARGLQLDTDQGNRHTISIRRTDNALETGIGFQNAGLAYGATIFHRNQSEGGGIGESLSIATIGNETDPTLLGETATFKNDGTVRLHDYGSGTNAGTLTQILGVEADGDVIEVAADGLGSDDQTAAEVSITDAGGNFTAADVEGALAELAATAGDNMYTADGTLTGDRTVTQNNFDLNFDANTLVVSGDNNRVGIGTNAPTATLSVSGGINTSNAIEIGELGTGDRTSFLDFHAEDGVDRSFRIRRLSGADGDVQIQNNGTGGIQFLTDFSDTRMSIGSSANNGNVGIGITNAAARLDVNGNARVRTLPASADTDQLVSADANGNLRKVNSLKASKVFYPPSIAIDASTPDPATNRTIDLHAQYIAQFGSPVVSSAGTIPTYAATELDYHVTFADPDVFGDGTNVLNMSIDANGILTYRIYNSPADYNALINVVFVVK